MIRKNEQLDLNGRLPAVAPLANPYVPFQQNDPPKYEARLGLVRGTLFPGLDLPFKGMINQKCLPVTPMSEMQALSFAIQELALYLDTHCSDLEALKLYKEYQGIYDKCMHQLPEHRQQMNHTVKTDCDSYQWLSDPWPWEYCANKEA